MEAIDVSDFYRVPTNAMSLSPVGFHTYMSVRAYAVFMKSDVSGPGPVT